MSEEQKTTQQSTENINGGDFAQTVNPIDRAERLVKGLEEANRKAEEILARNEQVLQRIILSGKAEAGSQQKQISPEEEKKQKAQEYWKGTAIETALKKYGNA